MGGIAAYDRRGAEQEGDCRERRDQSRTPIRNRGDGNGKDHRDHTEGERQPRTVGADHEEAAVRTVGPDPCRQGK